MFSKQKHMNVHLSMIHRLTSILLLSSRSSSSYISPEWWRQQLEAASVSTEEYIVSLQFPNKSTFKTCLSTTDGNLWVEKTVKVIRRLELSSFSHILLWGQMIKLWPCFSLLAVTAAATVILHFIPPCVPPTIFVPAVTVMFLNRSSIVHMDIT